MRVPRHVAHRAACACFGCLGTFSSLGVRSTVEHAAVVQVAILSDIFDYEFTVPNVAYEGKQSPYRDGVFHVSSFTGFDECASTCSVLL